MIRSFRHRGLRQLFLTGKSARVDHSLRARCVARLDALDAAIRPEDMNVPGFRFHALRGRPRRYSVRVSGNWRITFEWEEGHLVRVDLEDYH